ncbi:MAG: MBL fold metallo-hydrolase [Candidatus Sedimenticola endophacoides]
MRFASLGSGSGGNATLIESPGARLLLDFDCGFAAREVERRLEGLPVWMTHGTHRKNRCGELARLHLFHSHQPAFSIGDLAIQPFAVPHDASEPVQFTFSSAGRKLGVLTDLGMPTPHILERLGGCDALVLECNHDPRMLAGGPYPPSLRRRVSGGYGHLSNQQAAQILLRLDHARLRHLVAGHLSERNNRPELARAALLGRVPEIEPRLSPTCQQQASGWFDL